MNTRFILLAVLVLVVAMSAFSLWIDAGPQEPPELIPTDPSVVAMVPVTIYAYDARLDMDARGNVLCSEKGLVPLTRNVPRTDTPLREALARLFKDPLSEDERARGLSSEFPLAGVELVAVSVEGDVAIISVEDRENRTSGGSCRVGVLRAQIEKTALEFHEVKEVRFSPDEAFQP